MSLVGPRPERPSFVGQLADQYPHYQHRHRMKVGLTVRSQVAGLVGDTSIAERMRYANIYIDQWTLKMGLQIMFKTIWSTTGLGGGLKPLPSGLGSSRP